MDMDSEALKKELASIRMSAMNILAGREHSISELKQKLSKKFSRKLKQDKTFSDDFNDDSYDDSYEQRQRQRLESLIKTVLAQLLDDGLLDEARFTACFIRSRINKGSGPVKIRHELMNRGISSELSDDYLDNSYEFWEKHIEAARNKRFGSQFPKDYKEQSKQSRFLYQRGFSGELIRRLFNVEK